MNKNLKIIGIIVLLIAISATGWFLMSKNQKNTNKPVDIIKEVQKETTQDVIPEKSGVQNEDEVVSKDNKDVKNVDDNRINAIENEIWNQLISNSEKERRIRRRKNFNIEYVSDDNTIALGFYPNHTKQGGANIFAFRNDENNKWNIKITQEGLLCSNMINFSEKQIQFIKKNYIDYCVEFDTEGVVHKKML